MSHVNMNRLALSTIAILVLTACSNTDNISSNEEIKLQQDKLSARLDKEFDTDEHRAKDKPYKYNDGFYVLGKAFKIEEKQSLPPVFDARTSIQSLDKKPFEVHMEYLNKIYQKYGVVIGLSTDAGAHLENITNESSEAEESQLNNDDSTNLVITPIQQVQPTGLIDSSQSRYGYEMSLYMTDTSLRGILDVMASSAGLWWKFDNGRVTFYRTTKKTFSLDISDQAYSLTSSLSGSADSESSQGGTSLTTTADAVKPLDQIEGQLTQYLSLDGSLTVNRFDKTVTVTDTPTNLKEIEFFLKDYNYNATTMYAVTADVYEIVSEITDDRGVDWAVAFDNGGNIAGSILSPSAAIDAAAGAIEVNVTNGRWSGSSAALNLLNNHASIYSRIHNLVKTKNNIPTQVVSSEDQAILSGRSTTVDGNGFSQESLETKLIDQGFSIVTRPRRTSTGKIDVEIVITSKAIKGVEEFGSGDETIQQEETRKQSVLAAAVMSSGESAVITGYERELSNSDISTLAQQYPWWAGGNSSKVRYKSSLVVVVKPVILER